MRSIPQTPQSRPGPFSFLDIEFRDRLDLGKGSKMNPMGSCRVGYSTPTRWGINEKHFENVYNLYYPKVYGICRRYSSEPDAAKDLAHDVFVRYFQNFEKFRHESSPSTWMFRVAINLGIERWRREKRRNLVDLDLESVPAGNIQDNESMLLDRITLSKILDRYPARTRMIFSLFHIERMTQVEISKMLGISRTTVTRHLIPLKCFRRAGNPDFQPA
jgi:RNA polymerase sigma-70 factor (ECF subfamily)